MPEKEGVTQPVSYRQGNTPLALPGLALVGVKLLGIDAILHSLPELFSFPAYLSYSGGGTYALLGLLPAAAYLAVGIVLLWNAEWVVTRIIRVTSGDAPSVMVDEHFQAITFSLIGVALAVWGLAGLARALGSYVSMETASTGGPVMSEFPVAAVAEPLVELVLGVVLFLRGRGLAALWHRMRYGGVRVRPAE